MNFKKTNFIIIGFLLLGMLSGSCFFVYKAFVEGYVELDLKSTKDSLVRVNESLLEQRRFIKEKIVDWATWDEMATFVRDRNEDFANANLNFASIAALNVDFVAVLSLDLKIIGTSLPADQHFPGKATGKFSFLDANHSLISSANPSSIEFVEYGDQIAIVTAHTVSRGDGSDPGGKVVFLKIVDAEILKRISAQNKLAIELIPAISLPEGPSWHSLSFGGFENKPSSATGLVAIKMSSGKVLAYLRTEIAREILIFGTENARRLFMLLLAIFSGLIVAFVSFALYFAKTQELKSKAKIVDQLSEAQTLAAIGSFEYSPESGFIEVSPQTIRNLEIDGNVVNIFEVIESKLVDSDKERWRNFISESAKSNILSFGDFKIITSTGLKTIQLRMTSMLLDANASNLGSISFKGTIQDVSARVILENELEVQRNLAIRNSRLAALGEMAAGVAHEINNPVAIIESMLHIIREKQLDQDQVKFRIDRIAKATQRITKIVGGLKKFSGTVAVIETTPVNISQVIREAIFDVEEKAKNSNVSLISQIDDEPKILANSIEIEQLLVILLNNAIEAVKNLEIRWVKVIVGTKGNSTFIQVHDSGKGIPPEVASKLFQPFFTTKAVGEGTGLGLSIAKGIVDAHHGSIEILDNLGNTCFEIRFPGSKSNSDQAA
jgi:signal transduction histidine kinase/sensor domain CHASE-containing protein